MITLLKLYKKFVSPLLGERCKYHPSCSHYMLESIQLNGYVLGVGAGVWRVLRCNPFSNGGVDEAQKVCLNNLFTKKQASNRKAA